MKKVVIGASIVLTAIYGYLLLFADAPKRDVHLDYQFREANVKKDCEEDAFERADRILSQRGRKKKNNLGIGNVFQNLKKGKDSPAKQAKKPLKKRPKNQQPKNYFNVIQAGSSGDAFYGAIVDQEQTLRHGQSVILEAQETLYWDGVKISKGSTLYGKAIFSPQRILIDISIAKFRGQVNRVHFQVYDQDFLPGIQFEGLPSRIAGQVQDDTLRRLSSYAGIGEIQQLGSHLVSAMREMRGKKKFRLEEGKKVYIIAIDKKKKE